MTTHANLELRGAIEPGFDEVLTPDALEFVAALQHEFGRGETQLPAGPRRAAQTPRRRETLDFLPDTSDIREGDWTVAPVRRISSSAGSRSPGRPSAR